MIRIDGGNGGGAIVRVAVGLAAATTQPVTITNIRQQRSTPGMRPQHVAGVEAVAALFDADVTGNEEGSQELTFSPDAAAPVTDNVRVNVPTAGSVGLALQPLQIALADTDEQVTVTVDGGATAGKWAPPIDYVEHVTGPMLEACGVEQKVTVKRHGFYPKGGALVDCRIAGETLQNIDLMKRDDVERVVGVSRASQHLQEQEVAERQRKEMRRVLANHDPSMEMDIRTGYVKTASPGSVITCWAECGDGTVVGADAKGEKGKRAETVGREAADSLVDAMETDAPVDRWMADQLVPFLGLAGGKLQVPAFTDHVDHNLSVVQEFVDREIVVDRDAMTITVS